MQCSATRDDNTCSEMTTDKDFRWDSKGGMKPEEENLYKYVLDVDANYPSGKFKRLMYVRNGPTRGSSASTDFSFERIIGVRDLSSSSLLYSLNGIQSESCLYVVNGF